ncbi:MAG: hypothetical protein Q9227_006191 [Pyrenula ochraceoflavens]
MLGSILTFLKIKLRTKDPSLIEVSREQEHRNSSPQNTRNRLVARAHHAFFADPNCTAKTDDLEALRSGTLWQEAWLEPALGPSKIRNSLGSHKDEKAIQPSHDIDASSGSGFESGWELIGGYHDEADAKSHPRVDANELIARKGKDVWELIDEPNVWEIDTVEEEEIEDEEGFTNQPLMGSFSDKKILPLGDLHAIGPSDDADSSTNAIDNETEDEDGWEFVLHHHSQILTVLPCLPRHVISQGLLAISASLRGSLFHIIENTAHTVLNFPEEHPVAVQRMREATIAGIGAVGTGFRIAVTCLAQAGNRMGSFDALVEGGERSALRI